MTGRNQIHHLEKHPRRNDAGLSPSSSRASQIVARPTASSANRRKEDTVPRAMINPAQTHWRDRSIRRHRRLVDRQAWYESPLHSAQSSRLGLLPACRRLVWRVSRRKCNFVTLREYHFAESSNHAKFSWTNKVNGGAPGTNLQEPPQAGMHACCDARGQHERLASRC